LDTRLHYNFADITGKPGADIGIRFTMEIFQKYKQVLSDRPVEHHSEHAAFWLRTNVTALAMIH